VPTDMLIEGVVREPAVRGIAEVTRPGVAVPAQRETAQPTPERPRRGRRRTAWTAGGATVAVAAAAVVVAVVTAGSDDDSPTGPQTEPANHSTSYVFAAAADRTVRAARKWSVDASGKQLTNTTTVRNLTDTAVTRTAIEVIPKELAADVGDVELQRGYDVMQRDPIVRYELRIAPHATAKVTWSVQIDKVATDEFLTKAAQSQKREQRRTADRMKALAKRFDFSARAVVPFATEKADPGVTDVVDKPDRSSPSPSSGGVTTPSTDETTSSPDGGTTTGPRPVNHAPSLGSVSDRTVSELAGVGISLDGRDADGDALSYSARGLPAGLSVSGNRITGTVSHTAVTKTTRDKSIQAQSFTVTVSVSDGHKNASRTFQLTVRDTHRTMPNYVGKYGCGSCEPGGLPDIADLLTPTFKCHVSQNATPDTVYSQSISPGSVIRWGAAAVITYNRTSCS
jgi:hypothetical protein